MVETDLHGTIYTSCHFHMGKAGFVRSSCSILSSVGSTTSQVVEVDSESGDGVLTDMAMSPCIADIAPMPDINPHIRVFAIAPAKTPTEPLEHRVKRFLEMETHTESLDGPTFARRNASNSKADYLLADRRFVAELKTLNGDPTDRVSQRLKHRLEQRGAPLIFGKVGLPQIMEKLPDSDDITSQLLDLAGRAVRRHLQKAAEQIGETKNLLYLPQASGLLILMNDGEPLIDASNIAYSIRKSFNTVKDGYPEIRYIWVSVECHLIRTPDGGLGYPQLLIFKDRERLNELKIMGAMLDSWAEFHAAKMFAIDHCGSWDAMRAVYPGGTPTLSAF